MAEEAEVFITGTQAEYNAWHTTAKSDSNIPEGGKIGIYKGVTDASKQKTVDVAIAIPHPTTPDFFTWTTNGNPHPTKTYKTMTAIKAEGFLPDE